MDKTVGGVRERVWFPDEAWAKLQGVARALALDEKTLIRVCVALQLAQWEALYVRPGAGVDPKPVEASMTASVETMLPELKQAEALR